MKTSNKLIKILGLCMIGIAFHACDLDEYNPSGTTADTVFNTPEGYEKLINMGYANLRAQFYGREDIMFFTEGGTDLWFNAARANYLRQATRYVDFTPSLGQIKNTWNRMYDPVNYCNSAIERQDAAGFTSEAKKNEKVAEAHFLRAYHYWHIVEFFGGVTLWTSETKSPILTAQRSSVEDFYKLMIEDLEFAIKWLPVNQSEYGRADKKAAMGLLARVYLTKAGYGGANAATDYTKARDAAKEVIDNQSSLGVSLYSNFADVFNVKNNKANTEALFSVTHSTASSLNQNPKNPNRLHMWYKAKYTSYCGMVVDLENGQDKTCHLMPTLFLLDLFNEDIDGRYKDSFKETYYLNSDSYSWTENDIKNFSKDESLKGLTITKGDTALYFTKKKVANKSTLRYAVVDRDDTYNTSDKNQIVSNANNKFYPSLTKFNDPTRSAPTAEDGTMNVIVMRLAEMYLIAAEAELALNNKSAAADYVNVIRSRAAIKAPVDKTSEMQVTANDITLDFLLDERARELCGEHLRWFDLKRTGKLVERVQKYNPDVDGIQAYHVLRPVPQSELDALLNGNEYGQNPGYSAQ